MKSMPATYIKIRTIMNRGLLLLCLLLVAAPALAHRAPQDTAAVSPPEAKPALPLYFMPLYNSMIAKPIKLDFSIDPLLSNDASNDALTQRNLYAVRSMEQQIIDRLREEHRRMKVNAGIANAVGIFFWGALIEENIRGYINHQNASSPPPPPASAPAPVRPPELRRP
ncbi:MAG: hypothetical protein LBB31_02330 [Prevotellaceae bacterium]|jgi:hypothetical protein|nr:hypothetical protein [Prevotellaceae bacterium]